MDGDKIELWKDLYFEIIATLGHDKGYLCYKVGHYFLPEMLIFCG